MPGEKFAGAVGAAGAASKCFIRVLALGGYVRPSRLCDMIAVFDARSMPNRCRRRAEADELELG